MKKVNCMITYYYSSISNSYHLFNVIVKHKHNNIKLYVDGTIEYKLFNDLYADVLAQLKANNFYVHCWNEFGVKWYDIDFIDINGGIIDRYAFKE